MPEARGLAAGGCHAAGRFRALGHDFSIKTDDAALGRYLTQLLQPFAVPGRARSGYRILGTEDGRYGTWFEDEPLEEQGDRRRALTVLFWHINRQVVERSPHLVRLHAAAAALGQAAVILPAPMESGKTTLVAGLVRAGLRYLTDEVAAIDPETLIIEAYPKALSVDPGSWKVLASLRPSVDSAVEPFLPHQWQVPASSIRPDAIADRARPCLLVLPRYRASSRTVLERISRADALVEAVSATFDFQEAPQRDFSVLARLVRTTECYRLTVGDLDQACTAVIDVLRGLAERQDRG